MVWFHELTCKLAFINITYYLQHHYQLSIPKFSTTLILSRKHLKKRIQIRQLHLKPIPINVFVEKKIFSYSLALVKYLRRKFTPDVRENCYCRRHMVISLTKERKARTVFITRTQRHKGDVYSAEGDVRAQGEFRTIDSGQG